MSFREREEHSGIKEEKTFASDPVPLESPEDDKHVSGSSLTLESSCTPEHFQKEENKTENNSVEHSTENSTVQGDLDVDLSGCVEKELPLEKHKEKGEGMERITETEVDEVEVTATEETLHLGGAAEHSDNNILKVQAETEQCSEKCMEPESTQSSNTVEPSSSALDTSRKPELLNFLGDWPVQQTMGQRVKRARKLEKSSLKNDSEGKTPNPELSKEQAGLPDTCTVEKGQGEENSSSSCSDKVVPELQMLGHWPVSSSLEQRQQRPRRVRKTSLNQSDEGRSTEGDVNKNALETLDVLRGTPVNTAEQEDTKGLQVHQPETVASETVGEKKTQQSKRTRKHHKLALTFTNNNLPHPKEEEQLSTLTSAEEKRDVGSCRQISSHSQTESHDFALLWRLEKKMLFPETVKVLHGRLDGFKPKDVDNTSGSQEKIPYRVMYDKSTFVEESELINIDESEKLNMLCKLFESFSFEALKDLYERCNKDIDWATGLLLDSDEKLHKDIDSECFQIREAEPLVADLDFKENTNHDENLKNGKHTEQIIGTVDISEPSEVKNLSISVAESRNTKAIVTDSDVSDSFAAISLNDSVEMKNSSDKAPRDDADSSAAGVIEQTMSRMQTTEHVSPVEETRNKLSASELDAGLYVPMDSSHGLDATTNLKSKLNNESESSNPSESNAENAEGTALLLEIDRVPLIGPKSDKELETDKEMQGSTREIYGKEESETVCRDEDKTKLQCPSSVSPSAFNIDSLELTLSPELALQLKEIFGPVGIDAGMGIIISIFLWKKKSWLKKIFLLLLGNIFAQFLMMLLPASVDLKMELKQAWHKIRMQ